MTAHTAIAPQRTVADIIAEYEAKLAGVDDAIGAYNAACSDIEMAGTIMGTYVNPVLRGRAYVHASDMRKNLLSSGWKAIYQRLNIDMIATATDKRLFERTLADPPPLTMDNARATFGPYLENPRHHILRGLGETFSGLDPAYRSHTKERLALVGCQRVQDVAQLVTAIAAVRATVGADARQDHALAAYQGKPLLTHTELAMILEDGEALKDGGERPDPHQSRYEREHSPKAVDVVARGVWLKRYANGNGHLYFGPEALRDINRGLAEFYGEVLPDVDPDAPEKAPSTAVAKDLQFYWTPEPVIAAALEFAGIPNLAEWRHNTPEPLRILEPSCGDGRILDALAERGHRTLGIEYHAVRYAQASAKGHRVMLANFLECPPAPEFDAVVMNPPFYGRHYAKHVRHALKFLKPRGTLVAILPASAHYDHGELEGDWRDLPVASFAEAGTNVPTGMIRIRSAA